MGCDDLYEHGYISVDADGMIIAVPRTRSSTATWLPSVSPISPACLPSLLGLERPVFQWHRDTVSRRARCQTRSYCRAMIEAAHIFVTMCLRLRTSS